MKSDEVVKHAGCVDKIKRYNWSVVDSVGVLKWIDKNLLETDKIYQREHAPKKVQALASEWSWVACGTISVGKRGDGEFYIIDGQHRVLAALRRSDIKDLPCIVFDIPTIPQEADGFVRSNTHRKNMSIFDIHRAKIVSKDPVSMDLERLVHSLGLFMTRSGHTTNGIKCIGLCYELYNSNKVEFVKALEIARDISVDNGIQERVLGGLWYIEHSGIDIGKNTSFYKRLNAIPYSLINKSIAESVAYYAKGGNKEYATGILNAVNKGLRNKYNFVA